MTIHVYAEHAGRAGQRCWDEDAIERQSDDVWTIRGSRAQLRQLAETRKNGHRQFDWTLARTIREALEG